MPLAASGQLTLGEIAAEFGGSVPHALSEYYDKGNAPASGEINISDFHGTSDAPAAFGTEAVFNSGVTLHIDIAYDPNNANKFVAVYRDQGNSWYGTAIVGTISGTTITYGSEYVFNSGSTYYNSISFDPNDSDKFVVAFRDYSNSKYGTAMVGTISGTSISFGSEYVFNSASTEYTSISFDPNTSGSFVVAYRDGGNSNYGTAIVGTVSGTTISYGSEYAFNTGTYYTSASFDPNNANKFVVAYRDDGNSYYGTAIVGTVSGTSLSFGSEYVFNSASTLNNEISFDPNDSGKFVVSYADAGHATYGTGTAIVGTVSGTSLSFGSEYVWYEYNNSECHVCFNPNTAGEFMLSYRDSGNSSYGTAMKGTVSGTAISYGTAIVYNTGSTSYQSISADPNTTDKFVIGYADVGNSYYGTAIVGDFSVI